MLEFILMLDFINVMFVVEFLMKVLVLKDILEFM